MASETSCLSNNGRPGVNYVTHCLNVHVRARLTDALAPSRCLFRWQRRIPTSFYQQNRPLVCICQECETYVIMPGASWQLNLVASSTMSVVAAAARRAAVASTLPQHLHSVIGGSAHCYARVGSRSVSVPDAVTGGTICTTDVAGVDDINVAIAHAKEAQVEWASTPGAQRARVLRRAADLLREENDSLAGFETLDTGRPIAETKFVDVVSASECFEFMASLAATTASLGQHVQFAGGSPEARCVRVCVRVRGSVVCAC